MNRLNQEKIQGLIPKRQADSYKEDYGKVLLVGGSKRMGGAVILMALAAVHSGAGLVTVATDKCNHAALHAHLPEAMVVDWKNQKQLEQQIKAASVVAIGPGMGDSTGSLKILKFLLAQVQPYQHIIIDGSAITLMAKYDLPTPNDNTIYTPHLGEWERLSGLKPTEQNEAVNSEARAQLNATVVLKQHQTEVYFKEDVWKNEAGNPAMATGGMGDTLAGIIAGLVAQIPDTKSAVLAAVYLHSYIGDQLAEKQYVVLPTHIINQLPATLNKFTVD
ncbi:NAD(P)H-hydrate dehydratase [Carnobacterium mobile]|uniref:NAD(P)H-hydrate dehydratase n=1 Tax=Carnobacterium mobile TaxID=2750 RepID=UPI000552636C|nr:NAD(P)H-hydrate dehydratase [Carnobacterium mobile]